jgi:hypothetical protein
MASVGTTYTVVSLTLKPIVAEHRNSAGKVGDLTARGRQKWGEYDREQTNRLAVLIGDIRTWFTPIDSSVGLVLIKIFMFD